MSPSYDPPDERLGRTTLAGVHRLALTEPSIAGIEALARSLGYRVCTIDLEGCHDKTELLERSARGLGFPAWFGCNWDAWFDCLTDMSWHPVAPGYVILFRHALQLQRTAPEALDTALAIIEDAVRVWAERGVTLRAFVDDRHGESGMRRA
jgi:RNAse (barnase) inhibitor barstar